MSLSSVNAVFGCQSGDDRYKNAEYHGLIRIVQQKYKSKYGAIIHPKPDLFIYRNDSRDMGDFRGACFGISFAANCALFSEQYLNNDLQDDICRYTRQAVNRNNIAELGSVVSYQSPGAGKRLLAEIPNIMQRYKIEVLLVTATKKLRAIFHILHLDFFELVSAREDCLNTKSDDWGSYYCEDPITGLIFNDISVTPALNQSSCVVGNIEHENIMLHI